MNYPHDDDAPVLQAPNGPQMTYDQAFPVEKMQIAPCGDCGKPSGRMINGHWTSIPIERGGCECPRFAKRPAAIPTSKKAEHRAADEQVKQTAILASLFTLFKTHLSKGDISEVTLPDLAAIAAPAPAPEKPAGPPVTGTVIDAMRQKHEMTRGGKP